MRLRIPVLAVVAAMGAFFAAGCGDNEKYQRQQRAPANVARMLRAETGPRPAPVYRQTHELRENDVR